MSNIIDHISALILVIGEFLFSWVRDYEITFYILLLLFKLTVFYIFISFIFLSILNRVVSMYKLYNTIYNNNGKEVGYISKKLLNVDKVSKAQKYAIIDYLLN